jgi:hypothetical protein
MSVLLLILAACGGHGGNTGDDDAAADATALDARDNNGDFDNDGISDADEGRYDPVPPDTDGDGTPDWMDQDSDGDGLDDSVEGVGDDDGDGDPNNIDPHNDGLPAPITLTQISTTFTTPIGIDYYEPTNRVIMSVNYPTGAPSNFATVAFDGSQEAFSAIAGLTDELKLATARSGNLQDIPAGTLFTGNGVDGQVVKVTADGSAITNPWVDLPGADNGLIRGSLYVDRTGIYNGDLIICTTGGEVWRIDADANPTFIFDTNTHLEGLQVVPDIPVRFGPLAGKIVAGAEAEGLLWSFDAAGNAVSYNLGVTVEDIDVVVPNENFFGVNYGNSRLLGASVDDMISVRGDLMLATETVVAGTSGLFRVNWDGQTLTAQPIPLTATSEQPTPQWEHVTMAPAGIVEIPPVD